MVAQQFKAHENRGDGSLQFMVDVVGKLLLKAYLVLFLPQCFAMLLVTLDI